MMHETSISKIKLLFWFLLQNFFKQCISKISMAVELYWKFAIEGRITKPLPRLLRFFPSTGEINFKFSLLADCEDEDEDAADKINVSADLVVIDDIGIILCSSVTLQAAPLVAIPDKRNKVWVQQHCHELECSWEVLCFERRTPCFCGFPFWLVQVAKLHCR